MALNTLKSNWLLFTVLTISLLFSFFLISPVLMTIPKTPPNTVNMMVGHYYEDYFEYITFIKEGQKGQILISNLFTNDDNSKFLSVWWPYSVMGFITYLLKIDIPVQFVFWFSSAVFSFVFFILVFATISRLLPLEKPLTKLFAFLFVLFSGDFFIVALSPILTLTPINYWYAIGSPFSRFSNAVPHHQLMQIIFLAGLFFVSRKNKSINIIKETAVLFILSLLLLSLSPPHLILFWLATFITKSIYILILKAGDARGRALLFSFLLTLPIAFFLNQFVSSSPSLLAGKIWDINHYFYPSLSLFVQNTGPLLILAILGLPFYFSRFSLSKLLFFSATLFSFLFVLTPQLTPVLRFAGIHNLRFNSAVSYIFLSVSSILFIDRILRKPLIKFAVFSSLLSFFLVSLYANWRIMLKVPYRAGNLQFVPVPLYQGIKLLDKVNDDNSKTVLTTPNSLYSLLVTSIAGKRVYLGRTIFTLDMGKKAAVVDTFYTFKMTPNEAKDFLEKEKIGFILFSPWEVDTEKILTKYDFLKMSFQNGYLIILAY